MVLLTACTSTGQSRTEDRTEVQPVGSLCERIRPTLSGDWEAQDAEPLLRPLSDSCQLTEAANASNQFRISVSVLPVTATDAAVLREAEERSLTLSRFAAKAVDAGFGSDSWSVNPAAVGPWLVFRSGDWLVKVEQETSGQLEAVKTVAQTIGSLPGGIGSRQAVIERSECGRGTAAAEVLLGAQATGRRDELVEGIVQCRWASATATAYSEAGDLSSDAGQAFTALKNSGGASWTGTHQVKIGSEGWQQSDGLIAYRIENDTYVSIGAVPRSTQAPAKALALAHAVLPTYDG